MSRLLLSLLLVTCANAAHAGSFNPAPLVDEAIARVRKMAYRTAEVDWPALEARVRAAAQGANDEVDLLAAYEVLLEGLGDHHSFVQPTDPADAAEFKRRHGRDFAVRKPLKKSESTFGWRRDVTIRPLAIGERQAMLVVQPGFPGQAARAAAFARNTYATVALGAAHACGYVLDLRGNFGGNVWPMHAGLSALLGDGVIGAGKGPGGKSSDRTRLAQGAAFYEGDGKPAVEAMRVADWKPLPRLAGLPVAVLLDDAVASSGEGVAVAFHGRPGTRSFGLQTYGVASANEGVMVGRVNLVVTTGMMADRNGMTFPDGVPVDETVPFGPGNPDDPDDAVVEAAKAWLAKQPSCR